MHAKGAAQRLTRGSLKAQRGQPKGTPTGKTLDAGRLGQHNAELAKKPATLASAEEPKTQTNFDTMQHTCEHVPGRQGGR